MRTDRRSFLLGAIATAIAGATSNALAQSPPTFKTAFPNFERLMRHIAPYADVICLAQDDHADLASNSPLADRGVLAALRAQGATDLYFELSQEYDGEAKKLYSGEIGRTAFVGKLLLARNDFIKDLPEDDRVRANDLADIKSYEGIADAIIAARDVKGFTVHCIEPLSFRDTMQLGMELMKAPNSAAFVSLVEERLRTDGDIAAAIANSKRGKAVIQFGVWHFLFKSNEPFLPFLGRPDYNIDDNLRSRGLHTVSVHMTNEQGRIWNVMLKGLREAPNLFRKVIGAENADFEYASKADAVTRKNPHFPAVARAGRTVTANAALGSGSRRLNSLVLPRC